MPSFLPHDLCHGQSSSHWLPAAGQVVWYSHLFQNFPQFVVIHAVKGFGIVNKGEIDVFLELSCFFHDPADVGIWSLVPLPFLKPAWTSGHSRFTYCWSLAWRILSTKLGSLNIKFSLSLCFKILPQMASSKKISHTRVSKKLRMKHIVPNPVEMY